MAVLQVEKLPKSSHIDVAFAQTAPLIRKYGHVATCLRLVMI
jgi:hypothetical protein